MEIRRVSIADAQRHFRHRRFAGGQKPLRAPHTRRLNDLGARMRTTRRFNMPSKSPVQRIVPGNDNVGCRAMTERLSELSCALEKAGQATTRIDNKARTKRFMMTTAPRSRQ